MVLRVRAVSPTRACRPERRQSSCTTTAFRPRLIHGRGSCSLWCTSRHSQVCSSRSRCSGRQAWVQCSPIWLCRNTIHSQRRHRHYCSASAARSASQSSEQCCLAPSRSTSPAPMPSRLAFGHGATFAMAVSAGLAVAAFGLVFGLPRRSSGSPQMPPRNSARARAPTRLLWRSRPQPVGPRGHTPELSWRDPDGTGAGHART